MENKANKTLSIGSMDFFRGMGIIAITFGHTMSYFDYSKAPVLLLAISAMVLYSVINAFMIASGMGFRPKTNKKCFDQQVQFLYKPYFVSAVLTVVIHIIIRILLWHEGKRSALTHTMPMVLAYLFGFNEHRNRTYHIGSMEIWDTGTLWFILSLALATIILNLVLKKVSEKAQLPVLIILALIGFEFNNHGIALPYCLERGTFYALIIYLGYMIKKKKLLFKKLPLWSYFLMIAAWIFGTLWENVLQLPTWVHYFDFINIPFYMCAGFLLLKGFIDLNSSLGPRVGKVGIVRLIKFIGQNSIWFYCIHAIEGSAIPWYVLTGMFENPYVGFVVYFVCRWLVIAVGFIIFKKISGLKKNL